MSVSTKRAQIICNKVKDDGGPTYIGETRRQLFQRVTDHRGKDKKSAVFDHLYNCLECQSVSIISNQFEILKKCDARNLLTFEALLIEKNRPALNIQLGPTKGRMVSLALYNWFFFSQFFAFIYSISFVYLFVCTYFYFTTFLLLSFMLNNAINVSMTQH